MLPLNLLNFWIEKLNFDIRNDTLFVHLKAYTNDMSRSYIIPLSNDRARILEFFGFDISRDYDYMKQYNQFEFLCSSEKLDPRYISYFSFKGPAPKNKLETKFHSYLVSKSYAKFRYNETGYKELNIHSHEWMKNAISFFGKQCEYNRYKEQFDMFNSVIKIKTTLENGKVAFGEFSKFLLLHGIYNILTWDTQTLESRWSTFKEDNWSGLLHFRTA